MSDNRKNIRRQIRKINQASTWQQSTPASNEQAHILAGLNVLQVLETQIPRYLVDKLHYGPATFSKTGWATALVWYREQGYNNYQQLTLFGVWAVADGEQTSLQMATKPLTYSAPVFNVESYTQIIKQDFRTYYGDDGSPPDASTVIQQWTYDVTRRLAHRREIADAIQQWLRQLQ